MNDILLTNGNYYEMRISDDAIQQAITEYLNNHLFKEPLKVTFIEKCYPTGWTIRSQDTLQRLAGEPNES